MSRIGKKPIPVPKNVTATVDGQKVTVKGPKGQLSLTLVDDIEVTMEDGAIVVKPRVDTKRARSMWGMSRSLVENLVKGTTNGFTRTLEITGVGYRAAIDGKSLKLQLGYSHDVSTLCRRAYRLLCRSPPRSRFPGSRRIKSGR